MKAENRSRRVGLVGRVQPAGATAWAMETLVSALADRGWTLGGDGSAPLSLHVGLAEDRGVEEALRSADIDLPKVPESVAIRWLSDRTLLVAGRDVLGLAYGLSELAQAVQLAGDDEAPLSGVIEATEAPYLEWRSMEMFLCNEELEREWFFDNTFWNGYLDLLAASRYNNFSLTFAHQTSYLAPPYPFLVPLPEFPTVRVPALRDEDRERNLSMLRSISEMTRERGLHFTFGVWQQHDSDYGPPMVEGLDESIRAACNALGLRRVLEACPLIDGVQFRMNRESGVPEDEQLAFYEAQFSAVAACGRRVYLDIRAKGLADETICRATDIVPDTMVSTKYWCEHLGMPYLMPAIQSKDVRNYRRYGTWDLLRKPRTWPLLYRLWSYGTQKVLLWGNPHWVRRFVQSIRPTGIGMETMAPLTNKGYGNRGGLWRIIPDPAYQPFEHEYKRYWLFYLLFGRLSYNPDCAPEVWERELRSRFGPAAAAISRAYQEASGVMPFLTTTRQWDGGSFSYWPEMDAGRSLELDAQVQPSDPTQFYGVAEYVEDALAGKLLGKWTPSRVAAEFREMANGTRNALLDAERLLGDTSSPEFRGTAVDMRILAGLADYHAHRIEACLAYTVYGRTGEPGRLIQALSHMEAARADWRALSQLADGVYHDNLLFGAFGRGFTGHWKDRLPKIDEEVMHLRELVNGLPADAETDHYRVLPGERITPDLLEVNHTPVEFVVPGQDLTLELQLCGATPVREVRCYYRIANQTLDFESQEMEHITPQGYRVTIPYEQILDKWDLMYFFEIIFAAGEGFRWPDWRQRAPYFFVETRG